MKKIKRTRRYKEACTNGTFSVSCTHANHRIHDFIKGWGTVTKDGKSILWDYWRPATKRQRDRLERHWKKNPPFSRLIIPTFIKNLSTSSLLDILSVQPLAIFK